MKKKIIKISLIIIIVLLAILAIYNIHKFCFYGKQNIRISTSRKVFNNSDIWVSVVASKDNEELDVKTNLKLLNSKGKKVKNAIINFQDNNNAVISIPNVESRYILS